MGPKQERVPEKPSSSHSTPASSGFCRPSLTLWLETATIFREPLAHKSNASARPSSDGVRCVGSVVMPPGGNGRTRFVPRYAARSRQPCCGEAGGDNLERSHRKLALPRPAASHLRGRVFRQSLSVASAGKGPRVGRPIAPPRPRAHWEWQALRGGVTRCALQLGSVSLSLPPFSHFLSI